MKSHPNLEQQIQKLLRTIEQPNSACGDIDTCTLLYDLASHCQWNNSEIEKLDFLSKRIDISKKVFSGYFIDGRKAEDTELTEKVFWEIIIAILLKGSLLTHGNLSSGMGLKRFNTLFKALDIYQPDWLTPESELGKIMELSWKTTLHTTQKTRTDINASTFKVKTTEVNVNKLKVIPLTVLFYEGPIARAYLETIHKLGFQPEKIIKLVASKDIVSHKKIGKWLPKNMRTPYAASIQQSKIHYWPKHLLKSQSDFVKGLHSEVQEKLGFSSLHMNNVNALLPLSHYSQCVESLLIEGLGDIELEHYLSKEPADAILYTGGGIVPLNLLELEHLRWIHIHPGYLPKIRGADCTLWSSLLTGNTSASCFYMSPGIDTGEIIHSCWLPRFTFKVDTLKIDLKSQYRAIYAFLDPWIRAFILREIIINNDQFINLTCKPQSKEEGITFHFMHPKLQQAAFKRLFF